ncbi:MAG: ABC transporter permease [Bacillota bacterium]|nr:ABC transporter permease [Bacillota bacterium]
MKNNITKIVYKKEIADIFRDKKSVITSLLIPLLIFPILFTVINYSISKSTKQVENNLKISIIDEGNSSLASFLKAQGNLKIIDTKNAENDVKSGKLLLAVKIPSNYDEVLKKENPTDIEIIYDNSSQSSTSALAIVKSVIDQYSKGVVSQRLIKRNINTDILNPVVVKETTLQKQSDGFGKMLLSLMLPLLIVLYSVAGPMAPAIDLGAGEKERGTLEPLLTTKADRLSLLWGKFFAITTMGILTTIATLIGMFIGMGQMKNSFGNNTSIGINISTTTILLIGAVAVLTTMAFGALELSISIFARSFKEAQTYISPLTIVAMVLVYATYMLDAKNIEMFYFFIPLANISCIIKEFIGGIFNYTHIFITFGWLAVYILSSILFARYMFSREDVIFRT